MAQIIGLKEKQRALKDLGKKMKTIEAINSFLEAENLSGEYTLSFGDYSTPLFCKDQDMIRSLIRSSKEELVAQIRKDAEKYTIEFDENEEELLK